MRGNIESLLRIGSIGGIVGIIATAGLGCGSDPSADAIAVELAPEVISSLDGTLHARALVLARRSPQNKENVSFSVSYVDRNGEAHEIADAMGITDRRGEYEAIFEGLGWEGAGLVTATLVDADGAAVTDEDGAPIAATATFSVLDLTPPTVTILPPTADLTVGAGFPLEVSVQVSDEIGVSEVFLEATGEVNRLESSVVASGATEATVRFDFDVPNDARSGPTITLYAMASDLSGNLAAAEPVTITVDPALAFAVTEGLGGQLLSSGNQQFLDSPRAIALSPKNGALYVADNSGGSPCNDACVRRVDPVTGNPVAGVVYAGNGTVEGVAFDATGDTLFVSDRQNRLVTLTFNGTSGEYEGPAACNDFNADNPQDPMHLIFDAVQGVLVADRQDQEVKQMDTCDGGTPASFTDSVFDNPWGIAAGPAGEFYVSDQGNDRIYSVASNGDVTSFESRDLNAPHGVVWLAGGTTAYADSLMVANYDRRVITSTQGDNTSRSAVYLRNRPVDVDYAAGSMYIVTEPSNGTGGRIIVISGF